MAFRVHLVRCAIVLEVSMSTAQTLLRHRARLTAAERRAEIEADVAPYRGMTPEEHDRLLQAVIRAATQLRIDHPKEIVPEPPAPDFAKVWERLHARRYA